MSAPEFVPPVLELVRRVAADFELRGVSATVARGWKARARQDNQGPGRANRVVFMGSRPDGAAGRIVGPRQVGLREIGDPVEYTVRALADWERQLVVSVWAYDGASPNDEGAQEDACDWLLTETFRSVQAAGCGNPVWGAVKTTVPLDRAFGLERLVELTLQTMIPDVPIEVAHPSPLVTKEPSS